MDCQPTIDQLIQMMQFINEYSIVIPHYNLKLPDQATGYNFRPEKSFRLLRTGLMTYSGNGGDPKSKYPDITIGGITLPQPWIDRAYIHIVERIKEKLSSKIKRSKVNRLPELLLRFGGLNFLDFNQFIEEKK